MSDSCVIGNGAFWLGDCLELMQHIPDNSVDMVLCDLPYGTTACKWDQVIPFEPLWSHYWRVCKPNAAVVLTASQPFTSALIMSAVERFAFAWSWNKQFGGNFVQAKRQPIKTHEDVCVFSCNGSQPQYFPQMIVRDKPIKAGKVATQPNSAIPNASGNAAIEAVKAKIYNQKYPVSVIDISNREPAKFHPTQKPIALFDYLIRTYTNPGDLVLDNCAGSGTTAVAAQLSGRRWLCIEREPAYYYPAVGRVWKACNVK